MSSVQQEWFEKNYYQVLGVSESATPKEITSAYRKLARQFHPDANPGDSAAEDRFKEISAAYDVVGDADKRKQYDEVRRMGPMGGFGPGGFSQGGSQFEGADLSDLIGNLFSRGRAGGHQAQQGPRRGDDIETDLHLSFEEALAGVTTTVHTFSDVKCSDCAGTGAAPGSSPRQCQYCHGSGVSSEDQGFFSFSRTCSHCGGRGTVVDNPCGTCHGHGLVQRSRAVKVKIPHGVRDGQRIRVKGKGGAGGPGGPDGDLYVKVTVGEHAIFKRQGDNLLMTVPITFPEAAMGANISVPTAQGSPVTLRIPAGTRSGRTFRVRGQGVSTTKATGDLHVTVEVAIPQHLSDEERAALDAFAAASSESPRAYLGVMSSEET